MCFRWHEETKVIILIPSFLQVIFERTQLEGHMTVGYSVIIGNLLEKLPQHEKSETTPTKNVSLSNQEKHLQK